MFFSNIFCKFFILGSIDSSSYVFSMATIPGFSHTIPEAKLANKAASRQLAPEIKVAAKVAIAVSPAPETSATFLAIVGTEDMPRLSQIASYPAATKVIKTFQQLIFFVFFSQQQ